MTRNLLPILALFASTFFMLAGGGVQWIVVPIRAQLENFSTDAIGMVGLGWSTGFTLGCLVIPHVVRRVGHVRAFSSLMATVSISVLLTAIIVNPAAWFFLRVLGGLCFSGSYLIIESWINERSSNQDRGKVFAIYAIITQAGVMAGQYVIVFAEPGTTLPFMLSAVLFALAILPTSLSTAQAPRPLQQVKFDIRALYRNSPAALIGIFMAGSIAGSWQSFSPVYGSISGLSEVNIANMLALAMGGAILFQYPIGWASDRMDRRVVMVAVGAAGLLVMLLAANYRFDATSPGIAFFGLMLLCGGFLYPIYTVLIAHANDHADPEDYVQVSASLYLVYGFGTMSGPLLAARATAWFGAGGMFYVIAILNAAIAVYAAWRMTRREKVPEGETAEAQIFTPPPAQTPQSYVLVPFGEDEEAEPEPLFPAAAVSPLPGHDRDDH